MTSKPAPPPQPRREDLSKLPFSELALRYKVGVENYPTEVMHLSDEQLDTTFAPEAGVGTWSCRVLLGHLADAELAFVWRMRLVVAEDAPVFSVFDEHAFIDSGLYGSPGRTREYPIGGFVATVHTLRRWMGEFLATLKPEQWGRRGMHPERGEQTLRTILEYDVWHLEHHAWYLHRKVELLSQAKA